MLPLDIKKESNFFNFKKKVKAELSENMKQFEQADFIFC
jgi:hypothetical protein